MGYDPSQKKNLQKDLETFDDPIRRIGHDATSTFDNSQSNPTEYASSEAQNSATTVEGEGDIVDEDFVPVGDLAADAIDTGADDADLRAVDYEDDGEEDQNDVEDADVDVEGEAVDLDKKSR
jgi:hypothetical protein